MEILAVVPARGGSKGVPRKNLALVAGQPLIAYTIEAALNASSISRLVVSTDDSEIASTAKGMGAEVPFVRPSSLADDQSGAAEAVLHAVDWMIEHQKYRPDITVMLQPTSPLRNSQDIDEAVSLVIQGAAEAVISVVRASPHPAWTMVLDTDGRIQTSESIDYARRQDLPDVFAFNGAVYAASTPALLQARTFHLEHTIGYVMPPDRSLDVDTAWDLHLADLVLTEMRSHPPDG